MLRNEVGYDRFPLDPQTGFKDIDRELAEEQAEWNARDQDAINSEWDEIFPEGN